VSIERELKLTADVDMTMPDLSGLARDATVGEPTRLKLNAVYYDTPTLALARSGVTLRSRTGEGAPVWTLKIPCQGGSLLSRHEYTFDEPLGPVPQQARLAARALTRDQSLAPVIVLTTDRTEVTISTEGEPALKVCDDVVVAEGGAVSLPKFREIEVETVSDDVDAGLVDAAAARLRAAGCRDDAAIPKALRALGDRANDPPDVATSALTKRATVGELLRHVISKSVAQIVEHHAGVYLGDDPEDLHDLRVAARRLRSDLRTFAPVLDRHWTTWLRDELAWLGGEVGRGRDADVLAERLRACIATLPVEERGAAARLLNRVDATRVEGRQHVVAALSSDRYVVLLDALVEAANDPHFAADPPDINQQRARKIVPDLVRKPWRRVRRAVDGLSDESPDSAFHQVRIRSKRVRYAAEAVTPLFGRDARRFARAMADVQTVLGDHQDTVVAEAWLRAAAKDDPSSRLAVGELINMQRGERRQLRKTFKSVWKKASRRRLRAWLR
jgi:CHAD domain-containing protein